MSRLKELLTFYHIEKIPTDPDRYIAKASKAFAEDVVRLHGRIRDIDEGIEALGLQPYDTRSWYLDLQVARIARGFAGHRAD